MKERVFDLEFRLEKAELVSRGLAKVMFHFVDEDGNPVANVHIPNVKRDYASTDLVWSGDDGIVNGYAPSGSFDARIKNFLDVSGGSTYTLTAGEKYSIDVNLTRRNFVSFINTGTYYATGYYTKADISVCGGGGGGGGARAYEKNSYANEEGGGGGGGGYASTGTAMLSPKTPYNASVGAGGSGGKSESIRPEYQPSWTYWAAYAGGNGGASSFIGVSASGGNGGKPPTAWREPGLGGTGNGNGGNAGQTTGDSDSNTVGEPGTAGTQKIYTSYTGESPCGGGGGGGGYYRYETESYLYNGTSGAGGSPYGAGGGLDATMRGGGGGGGVFRTWETDESHGYAGWKGAGGYIGVRMHN